MKRTLALVLTIVCVAGLISGCATTNTQETTVPAEKTTAGESSSRTITDSTGRIVEVPATVERIVPLANTPRMITYLGLADRVVGISGFDPDILRPLQAYAYANKDQWTDLPVVGTDAGGATDYYPEEIIRADPDVIFCTYTADLADDIQRQTGIPVIAVPIGTLFGSDYEESLRVLADVCGVSDRAEEVISYIDNCLDDLATRTAGIPDADKPLALAAAATFKGPHGIEGVYSNYPVFTAVSANDAADGIAETTGGVLIDREQILGWDPDIIFFDATGVALVRNDFAENADFYGQLTAVLENQLYQYPNSTYYYSNVEIPIVNSYYVAGILYPEAFSDVDFEEKAAEIFDFFIGDAEYLLQLEGDGTGYGPVSLEDGA